MAATLMNQLSTQLTARRVAPMHRGVLSCAGATAVLGLVWLASRLFAPAVPLTVRSDWHCRADKSCLHHNCHSRLQELGNLQVSQAMAHKALRQFADQSLNHLNPYFPTVEGTPAIIPKSESFEGFVLELKSVLDQQQLAERAYDWIFSSNLIFNKPHPNCAGEAASVCMS